MAWRKSFINEFLDSIKSLSREEMLKLSIQERDKIQLFVKENRHDNEKRYFQDQLHYYSNLKGLVFFLEKEERPENIYPPVFKRFEWIARKLIKREEMSITVLDLF